MAVKIDRIAPRENSPNGVDSSEEPRSQGVKESRSTGVLEDKYNWGGVGGVGLVVSAFFAAPQLDSQRLSSCLPSPGCLASWLLGSSSCPYPPRRRPSSSAVYRVVRAKLPPLAFSIHPFQFLGV